VIPSNQDKYGNRSGKTDSAGDQGNHARKLL